MGKEPHEDGPESALDPSRRQSPRAAAPEPLRGLPVKQTKT